MSYPHSLDAMNRFCQNRSTKIAPALFCALIGMTGTIGVVAVRAYMDLSWSRHSAVDPNAIVELPAVDVDLSAAQPVQFEATGQLIATEPTSSHLIEAGLQPLKDQLDLTPLTHQSSDGVASLRSQQSDRLNSANATYETAVLPLLAKHGLDEAWFAVLCDRWSAFSGKSWARLSESEKVAQANELLYRLRIGLHQTTLKQLGQHDAIYYQNLTAQRQDAGRSQQAAHEAADERFFQLFPDLQDHHAQLPDTGFDEVWFGLLEDVIHERPMPLEQEVAMQ